MSLRWQRKRKGEWLLALLVLRSGAEVTRSWLAGTLWPESGETQALTNLRASLANLRRALGTASGCLRSPSPRTLALDLDGATVDLLCFDAAIRRGDPVSLAEAAALYHGPLLEGCAEEWVLQERRAREQAYLSALETLAARAEEEGDWVAAERHLRRAVIVDPLRESAQRALMVVLAAGGNYAAATQLYRELRLLLHREANAEPDPETRALYEQIRAEARAKANVCRPATRAPDRRGEPSWPWSEVAGDPLQDGTDLRNPEERRLRSLHQRPPVEGPPVTHGHPACAPIPSPVAPKRTPGLPSLHPPAPPPPNLPVQRTPLIGRAAEVAAVRELLGREGVGLVTLTGAGGSGKTRLGLQVASELLEQFSDGVFFVDLQPIRDAKLVVSAIAQTLAVRESPDHPLPESLKEHVRDKQLLLLVDNFEQVLSAAPHVAALLAAAPGLKVLVTSRAVLRVRGEHEFPVLPLAVPGVQAIGRSSVRAFGTGKVSDQPVFVDPERPNAWTPDRLIEYPAVELFVQRARVVRPDFALTEENAAAVAQICQRLDGLPLAMELAAARLKLLSPEALLARLDQRLKLLTGGARDAPARQQTLRDMIAWSYDLLSESEQRLLGRLSVFAGGASLEAVESVCMPFQGSVGLPGIDRDDWKSDTVAPLDRTAFPPAPSTELLDAITSLVDRSMVYLDETGVHGCRVCLLETIREFGLEQLALSREAEMAQRRHTEYFTALAEHLDTDSLERSEARRHEQMEREHDNFRAALAWCEDRGETLLGLRLAGTLGIFWMNHCYLSEGWGHLTRLLAQSEGQPPTLDRATALRSAGKLADAMGNAANAERLHQECLAIRQQLSDQWGVAAAWRNLGNAALDRGDPDTALTRYETAMAVCQQLGPLMQIAWMHHCLGRVLAIQGKYEHARTHLEACLAFFEGPSANPVHTHHGVGAHLDLALIDTAQGACASACRHLEQAMALLVAEGPRLSFPLAWMRCAGLAVAQGQAERAVRFLAAAKSLRGAIGAHLTFHQQQECDRTLSAARSALGEEAFAAAWATGQDMSLDEAIQYALVA